MDIDHFLEVRERIPRQQLYKDVNESLEVLKHLEYVKRDGTRVRVKDMSTTYITNVLRLCRINKIDSWVDLLELELHLRGTS